MDTRCSASEDKSLLASVTEHEQLPKSRAGMNQLWEEKGKALGYHSKQADPRGTRASQLWADNRQPPGYGNGFSLVHQSVRAPD